jgi:hypothetical protein
MAKPNYSFEKRKKELERKKKNEEKMQKKADRNAEPAGESRDDSEGGE